MRRLLLDTAPLILWVAGHCAPQKIGRHRRLSAFTTEQFIWLEDFARSFTHHVSLPNIMTEASNLIIQDSGPIFENGDAFLARYAEFSEEHYVPTRNTLEGGLFIRNGATDIAILLHAINSGVTVVTGDHRLFGMMHSKGVDCHNIWHMVTPE